LPTVSVAFTPLPAHVRTARFIAASVARRAGVADVLLDEIRLAVSEACSLAVRLHEAQAPGVAVELVLEDHEDRFSIRVVDAVGRAAPDADAELGELTDDLARTSNAGASMSGSDDELRAHERIGLAVIIGLVDDVRVDYSERGSTVTMTWPLVVADNGVAAGDGVAPSDARAQAGGSASGGGSGGAGRASAAAGPGGSMVPGGW
jgi:serine/threonine-protein kinase RsbW